MSLSAVSIFSGLILDNRSQDYGGCVWSFAIEMCWLEGYGARRVLFQGGTHANCYGIYSGFGLLPGGSNGEYGILMDGVAGGRIRDNRVVDGTCIHVTSESRGIVIEGNTYA